MLGEKLADAVFLADQNDRNSVLRSSLNRAVDFNSGRMVAAHGINGDLDHGA